MITEMKQKKLIFCAKNFIALSNNCLISEKFELLTSGKRKKYHKFLFYN